MWKPIPGYPRYEISGAGEIRCKEINAIAKNGRRFHRKAKTIRTFVHHRDYVVVNLVDEHGKRRRWYVHRLVLMAFGCPRPSPAHFVNHINGIKTDNRRENLEWVTAIENIDHAVANGLWNPIGSDNPRARLAEKDIPVIRQRLANGDRVRLIADDYGVNSGTIYWIRNGVTWSHVH